MLPLDRTASLALTRPSTATLRSWLAEHPQARLLDADDGVWRARALLADLRTHDPDLLDEPVALEAGGVLVAQVAWDRLVEMGALGLLTILPARPGTTGADVLAVARARRAGARDALLPLWRHQEDLERGAERRRQLRLLSHAATRQYRLTSARDRLVAFEQARQAQARRLTASGDADGAAWAETRALQARAAVERVSRIVHATRTWHDSPVVR